jgi:hypothetical protein
MLAPSREEEPMPVGRTNRRAFIAALGGVPLVTGAARPVPDIKIRHTD